MVDAFAENIFSGNPAAVCPLEEWLPDDVMQKLAAENNLAETAFIVNESGQYRIRWFTPGAEVALCGHATLASAHIFFSELGHKGLDIAFNSLSGVLQVYKKDNGFYTLDFPLDKPVPFEGEATALLQALGVNSHTVYQTAFDYMVVLPMQKEVEDACPDFKALAKTGGRGVIITAPGNEVDFVSRFFAPQVGIDEDPVTGSAHTALTPYWAERLGKTYLSARQLSKRGGYLECELKNSRVLITGNAVTYMRGEYVTG